MLVEILGIKNCDKVRAARKWLEAAEINYRFQDIREEEVKSAQWKNWLEHFGWEKLINKRSTSWKALDKKQTASLNNNSACALLKNNPTLMKRPLLLIEGEAKLLGFKDADYSDIF